MVKLKKPKKISKKKVYNFYDVFHYLEAKHGKNFRDYAGMFSKKGVNNEVPYLDWWHWFVELGEVHNGCYVTLPDPVTDPSYPDWVNEINQYWADFLGKDYFEELWLEW